MLEGCIKINWRCLKHLRTHSEEVPFSYFASIFDELHKVAILTSHAK